MEIIAVLLANAFVLIPIIGLFALIANQRVQPSNTHFNKCENYVTKELDRLSPKLYKSFHNLVIPSSGNTPYTEIDHLIVSPRGIFCIETKGHQGILLGTATKSNWTQCLGKKRYSVENPLWQNYKHTQALEILFKGKLKSKIHSFVIFPNIKRLRVDSSLVFNSTESLLDEIVSSKDICYNFDEYRELIRVLNDADKLKRELRPLHINTVNAYRASKAI